MIIGGIVLATQPLKVFDYVEELDCFLVNERFRYVADDLGISEWSPVVWIGRLFTLDNDYGEHWFDNWDLREEHAAAAEQLGLETHDLMIIDPSRFSDRRDGPCHSPAMRKQFWTDVLKSLTLSPELMFAQARLFNEHSKQFDMIEDYLPDLEERIERLQRELEG